MARGSRRYRIFCRVNEEVQIRYESGCIPAMK